MGTPPPLRTTDPAVLRAVAALADPTRRALYDLVRDAFQPVTREHAATALGISRRLAAFHLDKLIGAGLLVADYPASARARQLGRTPKAYRRAALDLQISIPERQTDVLAALLLDGITAARPGEPAREAVLRRAEQQGQQIGAAARAAARPGRLGPERVLTLAEPVLRGRGYHPRRDSPTRLLLCNCPFQPLPAETTELVCALNLHLLTGLTTGLDARGVKAVPAAEPGRCCVELRGPELSESAPTTIDRRATVGASRGSGSR